jgi:hypothetical protein
LFAVSECPSILSFLKLILPEADHYLVLERRHSKRILSNRKLWFEVSLGKQFADPYLENTQHKKGLVEW